MLVEIGISNLAIIEELRLHLSHDARYQGANRALTPLTEPSPVPCTLKPAPCIPQPVGVARCEPERCLSLRGSFLRECRKS